MSESLINSFKRFVQTADSFKNETDVYEWVIESLTQLIRSKC